MYIALFHQVENGTDNVHIIKWANALVFAHSMYIISIFYANTIVYAIYCSICTYTVYQLLFSLTVNIEENARKWSDIQWERN